ncbi:MAG: serpin family protein [Cytophagaceae bacterium]|nr:serpin family protein [Cytophagaceae bacterium]
MKKTIVLAFFLGALATASCQRTDVPTPGGQPLTLSSARFGAESSEFAFQFFQTLLDQETKDNVIASPLSLHIALGMLLNGADGQTAEELKTVLRLKGYSPEAYNEVYRQLVDGLPKVDNRVSLSIANSIWHRQSYSIEAPFVEALKTTFQAEARPLTNDVGPINSWVDEKTKGKIKKMYDEIPEETVLILLNAVYFKGDWTKTFDDKLTEKEQFFYEDGRKKLHEVQMMHQEGSFKRAFNEEFGAVELPYGNGDFRMTLLLPREGLTTKALMKTFSASAWTDLQQRLGEGKINVGLPRFEFEYEATLNATLQAMGIRDAFIERVADLTRIRKQRDLFVSLVKQKAYIKTDEKGSEAAAVTGISIDVTSAGPVPRSIVLNRPFLFFISEKNSNTVLFAGRVGEP